MSTSIGVIVEFIDIDEEVELELELELEIEVEFIVWLVIRGLFRLG
jgi:hypothetical protein